MENFDGNTAYAEYSALTIGDNSTEYKMTIAGYSGNAGDSMYETPSNTANNMKFSTKDNDNDAYGGKCATLLKGAWWYNSCHYSH